jgi:hypothetical protein
MALGFKEILWDSGGVWILVLTMSIVWLINTLKQILDTSEKYKGK